MKILLGVTGSIAAYRSPEVLRELLARNHEVKVILTPAAENFVTRPTLESFLGTKVLSNDPFAEMYTGTDHIAVARWADRVLIYGSSADFLAQLAEGRAKDFLQLQILATQVPVFVAPAMNPVMWTHPTVQEHVARLKRRGHFILGPVPGVVACGESGLGHVMDTDEIVDAVEKPQQTPLPDLSREKILISLGAMKTRIDPARSIENQSSGKMGLELARAARRMGAEVKLLVGEVSARVEKQLESFECSFFRNPHEYDSLLNEAFDESTLFISAAAILDFEILPLHEKLDRDVLSKQDQLHMPIKPVKDFVAGLSQEKKPSQKIIAFAAESGNESEILAKAAKKFVKKGADYLVANPLDYAPHNDKNKIWIFSKQNREPHILGPLKKSYLAEIILATAYQA